MNALDQCIDILSLTSFDWGNSRAAVVAHSFRVMSRARSYDEMVVGIMHHIYESSSYARGLFSCDVRHNSIWKDALDLFVEKRKKLKAKVSERLPDEVLLGLNMDQALKFESGKIQEWMSEECRWSPKYIKKIERIGANRIARNVMLYDTEDKLEMLLHPERFPEEENWKIALPWKKEYVVEVYQGNHNVENTKIPRTDDDILLRSLTESERANLVDKYSRAISLLIRMECADGPREGDFPEGKVVDIQKACMEWYDEWLGNENDLKEL